MPILRRKRFVVEGTGITIGPESVVEDRNFVKWVVQRIVPPDTNKLHPDGRIYAIRQDAGTTGTPEGKHPYDLNLRWR